MNLRNVIAVLCILFINLVYSQEYPAIEEQLELESESTEDLVEDDSWMEQLSFFKRHPLNINIAVETELAQLLILTPLQINNLIRYRLLLGPLIHVNELQAVPGWTPELIRKLLPFIRVTNNSISSEKLWKRMNLGRNLVIIRTTRQFSKNESSKYLGSLQNLLFKFQYNYGKLLQSGLLLEKDPGEPWLVNNSFDFTSFHLFIRELGMVKELAIGDFQVNMGQGLIQWQGMSTKKSASVLMIKKQDATLKPYRSAGETNFHRGIALTMGKNKWELMTYASIRKLSANLVEDTLNGTSISSILNSGYHRTASEMNDRNGVKQFSTGARVTYTIPNGGVAVNVVNFNYSLPLQKKQEPYQLFMLDGKRSTNYSLDYSYTFRNLHLFGEFAVDRKLNKAWVNGLLVSLDKFLDVSLVFRSITLSYVSINGNAFTESSSPNNETGLYAGMSIRPSSRWRLDSYADIFCSPWLKYRADAPSTGREFILQCSWTASKRFTVYGRWKLETKEENNSVNLDPITKTQLRQRKSFRAHLSWECSRSLSLRERWETSYYKNSVKNERGALLYTDLLFHPAFKPFDISGRILFFETGGYDSRIYTFEKNVLNGFSVPFFSGKGIHVSINLHLDAKHFVKTKLLKNRELGCYISLSHTVHSVDPLEQVSNPTKPGTTAVRFQFILQ